MSEPGQAERDRRQKALNLTLAGVAGQVGCLTLVIVILALFGGLYLDKLLDTKPLFTILLMVGSVPVTLFVMFRVVKTATDRIKPVVEKKETEEEINRGA